MIRYVLIPGLLLLGAARAHGAAADRITLRDGTVVLGLVTSATSGPRGAVDVLVRRDWAEQNAKGHLAAWDRAAEATARRAIEQRRQRLEDWRREREKSPGVTPNDRILRWIGRELERLADSEAAARTALVSVRLPRGEVRDLIRQPAAHSRLLRLAWFSGVRDPEAMGPDELTNALESRGLVVDAKAPAPPVALDRLLPPAPVSDALWMARRAATEIALDAGLRFLRYQDLVIPDPGPGQQAPDLDPAMALSEVRRLLDLDGARGRPDPLAARLQAVADRGRIGAAVTRLEIAPDLGGVTVETSFWVRAAGGRWVMYGSRAATVRADDLPPDAGGDIAEDPQVKRVFGIVEGLGLAAIPSEFKQRSLRIGAATRKALGDARSQFNRDLDALMLPVLDAVPEPDGAGRPARQPPPVPGGRAAAPLPQPAPRRSLLGPQDHR